MIEVDIVTPSRKIVDRLKTERVTLPTTKGQLTVLPGHTELLATLGAGILSLPSGGTERRFAVSYGFTVIRQDRVIVLAETCEESSEVDKARAQDAQKKAQKALEGVLTGSQLRKYQLKLERAIIRQSV